MQKKRVERQRGIEPPSSPWEGDALTVELLPHIIFCERMASTPSSLTLLDPSNRRKNRIKLRRYYGVSEALKSVHPIGNPMSHSTHVGFSRPPTEVSKSCPPSPCLHGA